MRTKAMRTALTLCVGAGLLTGCGWWSGHSKHGNLSEGGGVSNRIAASAPTPSEYTSGSCAFAMRNPAMRTENAFGRMQVRIYEDPSSPLYASAAGHGGSGSVTHAASSQSTGQAHSGQTGGHMQTTTSAEQSGSSAEIPRGRPTSPGNPELGAGAASSHERARLSGEDPYLSEQYPAGSVGRVLWTGWLTPRERIDVGGYSGPVRYEYRYSMDDRFHDNKSGWCSGNRLITVP